MITILETQSLLKARANLYICSNPCYNSTYNEQFFLYEPPHYLETIIIAESDIFFHLHRYLLPIYLTFLLSLSDYFQCPLTIIL